jgi:hypothetical protein
MKGLAFVAVALMLSLPVIACEDGSPPTVVVFIECDRVDSWTPEGEQQYDPGISISYQLVHYSVGPDQDFVVTSKGTHEQDRFYQQMRFYDTCRVLMGNSARDASPSLPNSIYVLVECSDQPHTKFINARFEKAGEVERPLGVNLEYEEFEGFKDLRVWVDAATADFFWETVDYLDCSARGTMIEELRASRGDTPRPELTRAATERTARVDCSDIVSSQERSTYGDIAVGGTVHTYRFDDFDHDVILVGLTYGRDETASMGSDFEDIYEALLGDSAYLSELHKQYWEGHTERFDECLRAHGIEPSAESEGKTDATTRCVAEGVAEAWKQYGDGALDYTNELTFTFDKLADRGTELSIGEAWSIADDYRRQTGRSPFKNPAAFELATSRNCEPWQGEGTGIPIAEP